MAPARSGRRVGIPISGQATVGEEERHSSQDRALRSRWDQAGAEFIASDSEWCDRFSARLIALVPGLDYLEASGTALDLASNDALRALAPEWVAEDMARAQVGLDDKPDEASALSRAPSNGARPLRHARCCCRAAPRVSS